VNTSHPPQTSSIRKWSDAPTRSVDVAGTKFVYRQLGPATGVPVIMLNHWGAVLDNFDPRIVDGLAATWPPNMRVQRTRSSPSALREPLTRHPLGPPASS
jgi:hypothetical protein